MNEEPSPSVSPVIPIPDFAQPPLSPATAPLEPAPAAVPPVVLVKSHGAAAAELAPIGTRIVAALIDSMVAAGLQMAVMWILPHFAAHLSWLVGLAYLVTRDSLPFLGGQSVGKKAMKLQVVTLDGQSLIGKWEPALIRNAVLAVPLFGFVELIVLLTREDKPERGRRLGDEWAKTQVILAPSPAAA